MLIIYWQKNRYCKLTLMRPGELDDKFYTILFVHAPHSEHVFKVFWYFWSEWIPYKINDEQCSNIQPHTTPLKLEIWFVLPNMEHTSVWSQMWTCLAYHYVCSSKDSFLLVILKLSLYWRNVSLQLAVWMLSQQVPVSKELTLLTLPRL